LTIARGYRSEQRLGRDRITDQFWSNLPSNFGEITDQFWIDCRSLVDRTTGHFWSDYRSLVGKITDLFWSQALSASIGITDQFWIDCRSLVDRTIGHFWSDYRSLVGKIIDLFWLKLTINYEAIRRKLPAKLVEFRGITYLLPCLSVCLMLLCCLQRGWTWKSRDRRSKSSWLKRPS